MRRNPVTRAMIAQAKNRVFKDRRRQAKQIRKVKHQGRTRGPFLWRSIKMQSERVGSLPF